MWESKHVCTLGSRLVVTLIALGFSQHSVKAPGAFLNWCSSTGGVKLQCQVPFTVNRVKSEECKLVSAFTYNPIFSLNSLQRNRGNFSHSYISISHTCVIISSHPLPYIQIFSIMFCVCCNFTVPHCSFHIENVILYINYIISNHIYTHTVCICECFLLILFLSSSLSRPRSHTHRHTPVRCTHWAAVEIVLISVL